MEPTLFLLCESVDALVSQCAVESAGLDASLSCSHTGLVTWALRTWIPLYNGTCVSIKWVHPHKTLKNNLVHSRNSAVVCNPNTWEAVVGGLQSEASPGQKYKSLSEK
jgi:hypothetical protein